MTIALDKRISALENAQPGAVPEWNIFIVGVPRQNRELRELKTLDGKHCWRRQADETEDAFRDRAGLEAPRNDQGVALLIEVTVEQCP